MEKQRNFYQKTTVMVLLAILCTALWGSASPCIKLSYQMFQIQGNDLFSKWLLAGIRFSIAGLLILLTETVMEKKLSLPPAKEFPKLLALGVVYTSGQYLFFYTGLAYTTGAKGALFSSVGCFFVVLLSPFLEKGNRYTFGKLLGCLLGFFGLVLISMGTDLSAMSGFSLIGDGTVLLSALCSAVSVFYSKRMMKKMSPYQVTGWQMLLGALVLVAVGLAGGGRITLTGGWQPLLLLGYMCLLSAVAYGIWGMLIKYNSVNRVSIMQLLTPVFGAAFSALILGEDVFTLVNLAALALVCGGIWLVNRE